MGCLLSEHREVNVGLAPLRRCRIWAVFQHIRTVRSLCALGSLKKETWLKWLGKFKVAVTRLFREEGQLFRPNQMHYQITWLETSRETRKTVSGGFKGVAHLEFEFAPIDLFTLCSPNLSIPAGQASFTSKLHVQLSWRWEWTLDQFCWRQPLCLAPRR